MHVLNFFLSILEQKICAYWRGVDVIRRFVPIGGCWCRQKICAYWQGIDVVRRFVPFGGVLMSYLWFALCRLVHIFCFGQSEFSSWLKPSYTGFPLSEIQEILSLFRYYYFSTIHTLWLHTSSYFTRETTETLTLKYRIFKW